MLLKVCFTCESVSTLRAAERLFWRVSYQMILKLSFLCKNSFHTEQIKGFSEEWVTKWISRHPFCANSFHTESSWKALFQYESQVVLSLQNSFHTEQIKGFSEEWVTKWISRHPSVQNSSTLRVAERLYSSMNLKLSFLCKTLSTLSDKRLFWRVSYQMISRFLSVKTLSTLRAAERLYSSMN